jgi:hypothetical protein
VPRLAFVLALLAVVLGGCSVDASAPGTQRVALEGPDFLARAAAGATGDPQAKWLLNQPSAVRSSYVSSVLDREGDRTLLAEAWLLRQPDAVRESYLKAVVEPRLP